MINVGADCFFASEITAKNNADAVKERTPKREILIPENFWRTGFQNRKKRWFSAYRRIVLREKIRK